MRPSDCLHAHVGEQTYIKSCHLFEKMNSEATNQCFQWIPSLPCSVKVFWHKTHPVARFLQLSASNVDQFLFRFTAGVIPTELGCVLLWKSVQVDGNAHQDGAGGKWERCTRENRQFLKWKELSSTSVLIPSFMFLSKRFKVECECKEIIITIERSIHFLAISPELTRD